MVLTPFVMPGETVAIGPVHKAQAALKSVVTPSAERVVPACPLFTRCGGCHYQHAPYEFQVARKVEILREQLHRVGKIQYDGEIHTLTAEPWGYRNRVQFHVAGARIGYMAGGSHELVALEGDCPVASPKLNQVLAGLREKIHDPRWPKFVRTVEVFTDEHDVQVNVVDSAKPVARRFYEWMESTVAVDYATGVGTFRVSPKSFFQVNRFLIDGLVDAAIGGQGGEVALDLYAGAGLFALPLAKQFAKVTGVEAGSAAAHDLRFNAERAGAAVEAVYSRVEDWLGSYQGSADFVLADPPRAGLGPRVVQELKRIAPERLTIVSCDPATLARDVAALGEYRIEKLTLVDLFPQTYHLETVAALRRVSS